MRYALMSLCLAAMACSGQPSTPEATKTPDAVAETQPSTESMMQHLLA